MRMCMCVGVCIYVCVCVCGSVCMHVYTFIGNIVYCMGVCVVNCMCVFPFCVVGCSVVHDAFDIEILCAMLCVVATCVRVIPRVFLYTCLFVVCFAMSVCYDSLFVLQFCMFACGLVEYPCVSVLLLRYPAFKTPFYITPHVFQVIGTWHPWLRPELPKKWMGRTNRPKLYRPRMPPQPPPLTPSPALRPWPLIRVCTLACALLSMCVCPHVYVASVCVCVCIVCILLIRLYVCVCVCYFSAVCTCSCVCVCMCYFSAVWLHVCVCLYVILLCCVAAY